MSLVPLFAAWLVGVISPGPDFVAVLRTSAARGRRSGQIVGVGVVAGIACWATLAMTGLAILLHRYAGLYLVLRTVGAIFLIGYGLFIIVSAWRGGHGTTAAPENPDDAGHADNTGNPNHVGESDHAHHAGDDAWPTAAQRSTGADFRLGMATNLANPKALLFFGALFASVLPAGLSAPAKAGVVAAMLAMALAWFLAVATVASSEPVVRAYRRAQRGIDTVAGVAFTAIGVALIPR